ncbi:MAG: hypothetical protein E6K12_00795 [Methanobacteriota archaeon]|nr:MAG: hypothetical protein E6K12_00795 [Euryarchaeota archaeon]
MRVGSSRLVAPPATSIIFPPDSSARIVSPSLPNPSRSPARAASRRYRWPASTGRACGFPFRRSGPSLPSAASGAVWSTGSWFPRTERGPASRFVRSSSRRALESARSRTSKASSQSVPDSENRAAGLITPFLATARIMLRKPTVEPEAKTFKFKICLVGEEGVGKTSLIHRFVSGAFDESYIRTLGAVVSKKSVALGSMQGRPVQVDMMILDIMGKRTFLQLFKEAYFHGAKGVLAVFDMTRAASLRDLSKWIDGVRDSVGLRVSDPLHLREDGRQRRAGFPRAREDDRGIEPIRLNRIGGRNHLIGTDV